MREIREERKCIGSSWTKYLSERGNIRVTCVQALSVSQELAKQHNLDPKVGKALTEAALAALLISSLHDDGEDINVKLETPKGRSVVDARPEGLIRGFFVSTSNTQEKELGSLAVLYTRNSEGKLPYQGVVELRSANLDENLDYYFSQSEQIPTSVGTVVETDGRRVIRAAGILVQVIGGASLLEIADVLSLDKQKLRSIALQISDGEDPLKAMNALFSDKHFKVTEERQLSLFCNCSQEKVERVLKMSDDLPQKPTKITCDFCRREYTVDPAKLRPDPLNHAS